MVFSRLRASRFTPFWLFLPAAILSLLTYRYLSSLPGPTGVNGYFYLKQIKSLGTDWTFYFKDYSLSFLLPTFLFKILGSELRAFQISISLVVGLFGLSQGFLVYHLARKNEAAPALSFAAIVMVGLNFSMFEFSQGFYKNFTAVTLFCFFLLSALLFFESKKRSHLILMVALGLVALLTHKSVSFLIALLALSFVSQRFDLKRFLTVSLGLLAAALLFGFFFENGFQYLRHLPSAFNPDIGAYWGWIKKLHVFRDLVLTGFLIGMPFVVYFLWNRRSFDFRQRLLGDFLCLLTLIAWCPLLRPGEDYIAYRLMLMQFTLVPVLVAFFFFTDTKTKTMAGFVIGLLFFQAIFARPLERGFKPYYQLKDQVLKIPNFVTPGDHLMCHHGLEFYVDYMTNIRCRSFLADEENKKVFRIVYVPGGRGWNELLAHLESASLLRLSGNYFLLAETEWKKVSESLRFPPHRRNTFTKRPDHIYK